MSLGEDDDRRGTDDPYTTMGGTRQTRTRMPEDHGSARPRGTRQGPRASRSMIAAVAVVVLLIAAIAFANRGPGSGPAEGGSEGKEGTPSSGSTAASGEKPVTGKGATGIPSGFARNAQGAQSAATNYTVALGSVDMFKADSRHRIVDSLYTPESAAKLKGPQDTAYSPQFLQKLGLDAEGNAPSGSTFVSRTLPVGAKTESVDADNAKISVWYTGLIGMSGAKSIDPVKTNWGTWTFDLKWVGDDWKIVGDAQKKGPTPVPGDETASSSDEISKAVDEYGGFTYAR
ncbi:hypothetical protein ACFYVL_43450 [Streptomyces sp. NPDC004111]|uniref:hypothetical protein n=1 Tax=Streptomyces sp. NPDC004111 TaxID=3364690 RepID=UPI0036AA5404